MSTFGSTFSKVLRDTYHALFIKQWSTLSGAICIGVLSVVAFAWARPWGVAGGYRVWGDWIFYGLGLYETRPISALLSSNSIITLGLLWGAMAASLISKSFSVRVPPRLELYKGLAGGACMGIGAAFAGGCNVGGFYSSISALSLSGFAMLAGLLGGAALGLKYLYWEMEHLADAPQTHAQNKVADGFDWSKVKPAFGWLLLAAGLGAYQLYRQQGYVILGGILLCGVGFGFILGRSRFCFARAFREPFMSGDAEVAKAVILSLLISVLGFAVIKWSGFRGEMVYVTPTFGLGALGGGVLFGFGMLLAGGCGSGTAWRAAEGQIKLVVALIMFCLFNSITKTCISLSESVQAIVGRQFFLPHWFGYQGAVIVVLVLLAIWYVAVEWNEQTDAMVIEM